MRGARARALRNWRGRRIIPADAGSTTLTTGKRCFPEDHPRGCGEHQIRSLNSMTSWGSSPRMRGAPSEELDDRAVVRIIPADAGSTVQKFPVRNLEPDHPRGCGEHGMGNGEERCDLGSSPRMRGAQRLPCDIMEPVGIIPADAGSTCTWPSYLPRLGDHPRGCGEHT